MIARALVLLAAGALAASAGLLTSAGGDGGRVATPPAPSIDGASLFRAKGCATCHDGPGATTVTGVGPSLDDARAWAGTRIDGVTAEVYLTESIVSPQSFASPVAGGQVLMPTLAVTAEEVEALVAYLLAPPP